MGKLLLLKVIEVCRKKEVAIKDRSMDCVPISITATSFVYLKTAP